MLFRLFYSTQLRLKIPFLLRTNSFYTHSSSFQYFVKNPNIRKRTFLSLYKFSHGSVRLLSTISKRPAKKELRRLISVAKSQKWKLSGAVLFLLISSTVTVAVPFCVGRLIDIFRSSNGNLKESLNSFCIFLIVAFIIGAMANAGRVYLMNLSSHHVINSLRKKAYASILCQEAGFFDQSSTGELINRLSADTTTVGMSVTNNISDGLRSMFTFVGSSCLMVYTSPSLAFLGLMTVLPVTAVAVFYAKVLKRNSQAVQDALADATKVSEERISNIRTVQAFAKYEEESKFYDLKISNVLNFAAKDSLGQAKYFGMTGFSGNLIILTVLYQGGLMMNNNEITIGGLSAFLLYAAYVGISIGGLSSFYSELMRGLGASTRLWELIDRKPMIPLEGGISLLDLKGNVSFNNIFFTYPSRPDTFILSNFSLNIPCGSVYALVGSSGCGKSTIGSLLLRLYDCQKGSITVDGQDIKSLNAKWLRKNIGLVSQDPVLFSHSIRENILYGAENSSEISDTILESVLNKANALDFVRTFPDGLDTLVGERGVMLSGGQRQRIAIARAILKNPKILILDEATSALDAESEYLVQSALEQLMSERTVITIAHRLSTVKKADVIVVLEHGRVMEQGSYEELINKKGAFHRLVQLQSLKS